MRPIDRIINVLKCSHPFSVTLASMTGILVSVKIISEFNDLVELAVIFVLAQLITGFLNDYLDYNMDLIYQENKPAVRLNVRMNDIIVTIILCTVILLVFSFVVLPVLGFAIVFIGLIIAQSYNMGLKDTILSGMIFTTSFGLMMLVPIFYVDEFPYSLTFLISGSFIGFAIHLVNANLDLETDLKRGSKSMAVWLGRKNIRILIITLNFLIVALNYSLLMVGLGLGFVMTYLSTHDSTIYSKREWGYYICSFISLLLIYSIDV